jgi:hypothetical protein
MADSEKLIREYYSRHNDKMIECPFQPGNLKISEKACLERYKAARQKRFSMGNPEDSFVYFISQGLLRCEKCPIPTE